MKMDRFLQLFVVKEKKFYPLYIRQAELTETAAELLGRLMREAKPENRGKFFTEIRGLEKEGDQITARIYRELNRSFVTPFDREDVNRLASQMDDLLDHIHDAARRVVLYNPVRIDPDLTAVQELILEDARLLAAVMKGLVTLRKKPSSAEEKCRNIKLNEQHADRLYESYMSTLFAREKNLPELLKLQHIVQALEDTADTANDVANTIKGIIIKFA
ncbi:MAG: DUF47 family protein [Culturomica sp.]|jgi:predicted phosphate transport protein (TIGR00153 family)|nr:DUF47 family protein [Culturomica sp.]